jgi:hypothetical protein
MKVRDAILKRKLQTRLITKSLMRRSSETVITNSLKRTLNFSPIAHCLSDHRARLDRKKKKKKKKKKKITILLERHFSDNQANSQYLQNCKYPFLKHSSSAQTLSMKQWRSQRGRQEGANAP